MSVMPSTISQKTHEMLPHARASARGMQTKSSLQIGTISTEYVNL